MGLDLTLYNKDKTEVYAEFSSDGWIIVHYIRCRMTHNDVNGKDVKLSKIDIKNIIECCKDILQAYYTRTFEDPDCWVPIANAIFPINDEHTYYIDSVSFIYYAFWELYTNISDNEEIICYISY